MDDRLLYALQLIAHRARKNDRDMITLADIEWAIQELKYPRDDGTAVAVGGEPGASAGASE